MGDLPGEVELSCGVPHLYGVVGTAVEFILQGNNHRSKVRERSFTGQRSGRGQLQVKSQEEVNYRS